MKHRIDATASAGTGVGTKFHADGTVRRFPGNTVVAMLDDPALLEALAVTRYLLEPAAQNSLTFLPKTSLHMTVFELLCDQVRQPERWSRFLDLDAPLHETDDFVRAALASVEPPTGLRMRPRSLRGMETLLLYLDPADPNTQGKLAAFRERISERTGVRFPDHDRYQFHIGIAYEITCRHPTVERDFNSLVAMAEQRIREIGTFELPPPQLRFFDDMFEFRVDPAGLESRAARQVEGTRGH